jgi:hypothetical protein
MVIRLVLVLILVVVVVVVIVVVLIVAAVIVTNLFVVVVLTIQSMSKVVGSVAVTTAGSCVRRLDFIAQGNVNARVNYWRIRRPF